jgi:hypothetical protein
MAFAPGRDERPRDFEVGDGEQQGPPARLL